MENERICKKVAYKVAPNIALIKYWGKFDEEFILPLNNSISVTLSNKDLFSLTEVTISSDFTKNILFLNKV